MHESFIAALPDKVRSAEFKDEGTRFRKKEKALAYRYVELNQLYKKFIALDIDKPESAFLWDERGLPHIEPLSLEKILLLSPLALGDDHLN